MSVPASVLTDVLIGAHFREGASLRTTLEVLAAKLGQHILVTRDAVFSRIPGLACEAY